MGNSPSQHAIKTLSLITSSATTQSTDANELGVATTTINTNPHFPGYWIADSSRDACSQCDSAFSFTNRRHHCRLCGNCLCGTCCASVTVSLPLRETVTIRACGPCRYVQIDALNNIRKADAFQMPRVLEAFLNQVAYVSHDGNANSSLATVSLFPSSIVTNEHHSGDVEWIELFKEKGGKCQENLVFLEDLIDDAAQKHHRHLSDRERRIYENFHGNRATFHLLQSKESKLETDESCVLLFRCLHYFALSRPAAAFLHYSSTETSNLLGTIQFHRTPEAFRWFSITMAYILGSAFHTPLLRPSDDEIKKYKANPDAIPSDWNIRRRRSHFCSFILRNTYIEASHHILKSLAHPQDFRDANDENNTNGGSQSEDARETLSWLLLGLYFLASLNACNETEFRGDPNDHNVGFGFAYDHRDGAHKGNLVTNLNKIVNERLVDGENGLSEQEKKWYDYVTKF